MIKVSWVNSFLLSPIARVYDLATSVRNWLYDVEILSSYTSKVPVVCIGNITAGGNGKTPLCVFVVRELRDRGRRPVILSRGYGGRKRGPYLVVGGDSPSDVGDEAILMSRESEVPVVVSRSRVAGARFIEAHNLGDVIVLDDGFQHRALNRNVNIVSLFAGSEEAIDAFCAGELLPAGRFRENRVAGLRRASSVVISYRRVLSPSEELAPVSPTLLSLLPPGIGVFRASMEFVDVRSCLNGDLIPAQRVHALAAIANPEGFFMSLEQVGFTVERRHVFPDHHAFSEIELRDLIATHPNTIFVCTEKDGVKIRAINRDLASAFAEFRVRLKVSPSDSFMVSIMREIQPRSGAKNG
jgi:tetraacyldisaccharide 4'-kinase